MLQASAPNASLTLSKKVNVLINNQLAEVTRNAWISDQEHSHRDRSQNKTPSQADFELILDVLFKTSLMTEEGKSAQASVAWIDSDLFEQNEISKFRDTTLSLKFDEPLPFEPRVLAKLNHVTNGKTSALLVGKINEAPKIWGICYFSQAFRPFEDIPAGTDETRHFAPDCLTITITGVGSLLISRSNSVIGRIETGEFHVAEPTPLSSFALGGYIYKLIGVNLDTSGASFSSDIDQKKARSFNTSLNFIINALDEKRSGATVIFVPDTYSKKVWINATSAWKFKGDIEVDRLLTARQKFQDQISASDMSSALFVQKSEMILRQRLNSLVQLAQVDGALILTPSFIPLGFGVKLSSDKWKGEFCHGDTIFNNSSKTVLDFTKLGTRHNSAANFVGANPEAIAFVASSDGPIRAIVRASEEKIMYWPDSRVSMFTN